MVSTEQEVGRACPWTCKEENNASFVGQYVEKNWYNIRGEKKISGSTWANHATRAAEQAMELSMGTRRQYYTRPSYKDRA